MDSDQEDSWNNYSESLSSADFEKRKRKFKKNKKYRKEILREEKMNTTKMERNTVEMRTGEKEIIVTDPFPLSYNPGNVDFDKTILRDYSVWHQVFIHHNRGFNCEQILDAFFKFIPENDFYPVAYREGKLADYFFLHGCDKALEQLLTNNCKLPVDGQQTLDLTIKLAVAKFQPGQITQNDKIMSVLHDKLKATSDEGYLNLESFASHPLLADISMSLSNISCFRMICSKINLIDAIRVKIRRISFASNGINTVEPFKSLNQMIFKSMDLRNNHILDLIRIKCLKDFQIEELFLEGNPVTRVPKFYELLKEALPTLRKVDSFEYMTAVARPSTSKEFFERKTVGRGKRQFRNDNDKIDFVGDGDIIRTNDVNSLAMTNFKKYNNNRNCWHQVLLYHEGKYRKEAMLKALIEMTSEHDFYPTYYKQFAKQDEFFLHNCFDALESMMKNSRLILRMPGPEKDIVNIVLKMNVSEFRPGQINYYDKINYVLFGRYHDGTLDLTDFRNDVEFSQICVPLNTFKGISNVIQWASEQFANLTRLNMQKNEIKSCTGLAAISYLPNLRILDLRWNNIESMADFSGMAGTTCITELFLDGNPICKNYSDKPEKPIEFVNELKGIFTYIEYIDGVRVKRETPYIPRQNYLCAPTAYTMIENFIRHYFMLYDSPHRLSMRELYSKDSIFTMSCHFQVDRVVEQFVSCVRNYTSYSRNILKMSDYASQSTSNLILGAEKISKFFSMLPLTDHDPKTFTIDVPMHKSHATLIIVCGVFREKATSLMESDFICGFSRTFLLKAFAKKQGVFEKSYEYKIYNEHLHLHNLSASQKAIAFKEIIINTDELENRYRELMPTEIENKEAKILLFKELTELKREWCVRLLDESQWNIKVSLTIFLNFMENGMLQEKDFD